MGNARNLLATTNWGRYLIVFLVLLICFIVVASFAWYRNSASQMTTKSGALMESSKNPPRVVTSMPNVDSQTTHIESAVSSQSEPAATTQVRVNNEPISVPPSGVVHKVIKNENGTTTIDVSSSTRTSGASNTNSQTNVDVNTVTESSSQNE